VVAEIVQTLVVVTRFDNSLLVVVLEHDAVKRLLVSFQVENKLEHPTPVRVRLQLIEAGREILLSPQKTGFL
jgi:hypothetical protein